MLDEGIRIEDKLIPNGTEITVDGTSGLVFLGAHGRTEVEAPEVAILRSWLRDTASGSAPAQAVGYKESATLESVSRALAIKGMGDAAGIADVLGGRPMRWSRFSQPSPKRGTLRQCRTIAFVRRKN